MILARNLIQKSLVERREKHRSRKMKIIKTDNFPAAQQRTKRCMLLVCACRSDAIFVYVEPSPPYEEDSGNSRSSNAK